MSALPAEYSTAVADPASEGGGRKSYFGSEMPT